MCLNDNHIKCIPRISLTKRQRNLCNDQLAINRDIVCCALAACLSSIQKPVKCLEGIGICGINGMLWEKYFGNNVDVTINGSQEDDFNIISKNLISNKLNGKVVNEDPCIILRKFFYDFIFLNCKTNTSKYLDSLFANIKEDAIFVITTSEDPSLYWQTAEIALRNYGGVIVKTSFHREVAVRLVIAEMARASARYNKGLNILCTIAYKPQQSFTIIGTVKRGTMNANKCVTNIKKLAFCSMCENWKFMPNSNFLDKLNNVLNCDCSKNSEGKVTIGIGPLWTGEIFNVEFIESMSQQIQVLCNRERVCNLLKIILEEARCDRKFKSSSPPAKKQKSNDHKQILEEFQPLPYFYVNTHRHNSKELSLQKLSKIICLLQSYGYCASRTHFDTEAVRTNASIPECISILEKNSNKL